MANQTHAKARMEVIVHDATMLELVTRQLPEGASQTFKLNSPVALSSGLVVEFVAPATLLLAGYAMSDGKNVASGGFTDVVLAMGGVEIEANFLGSGAADQVLAAANLGSKFDLGVSASLFSSTRGWYIQNTAADPSHRICAFPPLRMANVPELRTQAGDTNARVRARFIATKSLWNDVTP